jgi:predicted nucleic acid-binding protein
LKENKDELITSLASITETLYLLDFNVNAQLDFLEWAFKGAVLIENIANKDFAIIRTLMNKYKNLPIDFADACLILLSEKLKINRIITIDGDFNIYRTCGKKFKILP